MSYKRNKNKFPYTKNTAKFACIWHYSDGGYERMLNQDNNLSIFGVPISEVKKLVADCIMDGRYDKYIKDYKYREHIKSISVMDEDGCNMAFI